MEDTLTFDDPKSSKINTTMDVAGGLVTAGLALTFGYLAYQIAMEFKSSRQARDEARKKAQDLHLLQLKNELFKGGGAPTQVSEGDIKDMMSNLSELVKAAG